MTTRSPDWFRLLSPADAARRVCTGRLRRQLVGAALPRHVAVIMDGNRRWARAAGFANPSLGHRVGGEHLDELLGWCTRLGIHHVTAFVCSTENLQRRADEEVAYLMDVVADLADRLAAEPAPTWVLHVAGWLDVLPDRTSLALKAAVAATAASTTDRHLTLAIGYGGRQEVVDAVRDLLRDRAREGADIADVARQVTTEAIAARLRSAGQPDPDLVIRTSGEQRLSNFLVWQSSQSELAFCDTFWPAFRELDFLRELRRFVRRRSDRTV